MRVASRRVAAHLMGVRQTPRGNGRQIVRVRQNHGLSPRALLSRRVSQREARPEPPASADRAGSGVASSRKQHETLNVSFGCRPTRSDRSWRHAGAYRQTSGRCLRPDGRSVYNADTILPPRRHLCRENSGTLPICSYIVQRREVREFLYGRGRMNRQAVVLSGTSH